MDRLTLRSSRSHNSPVGDAFVFRSLRVRGLPTGWVVQAQRIFALCTRNSRKSLHRRWGMPDPHTHIHTLISLTSRRGGATSPKIIEACEHPILFPHGTSSKSDGPKSAIGPESDAQRRSTH